MRIRDGTNILVATVGRLLDFIEKGVINTSKIQFVILDEADRMLDMGKLIKRKMEYIFIFIKNGIYVYIYKKN